MKFYKSIRKGDIILVFVLIFLCILWFLPNQEKGSLKAEVYLNGDIVHTVVLSELESDEEFSVASCNLLFEKDGVTFVHSECDDKLCEKRGKMTKSGDTMACVPQKVVVVLRNDKKTDFDSVAY